MNIGRDRFSGRLRWSGRHDGAERFRSRRSASRTMDKDMTTFFRAVACVVLVALLGACGSGRGRSGPAPPSETTTLRLENQSWSQMTIYVVAGGQRIRLGSVEGNSTGRLRIPGSVVGMGRELSFMADPLGSSNVARSFSIYVRPGEEVSLTIPPSAR